MSKCIIHDMLLGQRIPRITEPNTAPEALCKLPTDVPGIAPFDIKSVYKFTDEEFYMDLYATYTDITKTQDGVTATKSDACLDEIDTAMDTFTWISWIESVNEHQTDRKWIIYALLCTPTGDLSDDPDFKRPAIPFAAGGTTLTVPFAQFVERRNVHVSSVEVDLGDTIVSYDITYPPSWDPPSWEPPSWEPPSWEPPSLEPPWESYEPPWESYEPPWESYEPPSFEIPEIPSYYYETPPQIDTVEPPKWYSEAPEWFSVDPYPPVFAGGNGTGSYYDDNVCAKFSMRSSFLIDYEKHGCDITVGLNEENLIRLLCDQFTAYTDETHAYGRTIFVIGSPCDWVALDLRMIFAWEETCQNVRVRNTDGGAHVTVDGIGEKLLGVDSSVKWLKASPSGSCKVRISQDFNSVGQGILTWGEDGDFTNTPIESGKYLTYQDGKVTWIDKAECEH